ncbi:MAG TPA: MerR family transcriptional regulator [Jatrophihabitans sp.]|nr:MerR family transcriptional regulator [Jatrophihabitans sp.]
MISSAEPATMRAGELAAAAGVNLQTLRYYERRGLLPEPQRTLGGHRQYPTDAVLRLAMIKSLQRLGFTLTEVAQLMGGGRRRDRNLHARADAKIADIDRRIAELTEVRAALVHARDAGCRDLVDCVENPACPLPLPSAIGAHVSKIETK